MNEPFPSLRRREFLKYPLLAAAIAIAQRAAAANALVRGHSATDLTGKTPVLVRNARVYTADQTRPWAQAIAIHGGRITWVGDDREAHDHVAANARVIDAGGRLVLPGFIDSHNHIDSGSDPDQLRLGGTKSLADIQEKVRSFAQQRPDLKWIVAVGWNYSIFPAGGLPTSGDLEGLTQGRPVFLVAYDSHTIWLNKEALRAFGITRNTAAPDVQKDAKTGVPTGILIGLSSGMADGWLAQLPTRTPQQEYASFQTNLSIATGFGITTVVDPQCTPEHLQMYARARTRGELPLRMQVALFHRQDTPDREVDRFSDTRRRFHNDDRLRVSAVKLYSDDVIEPHTAALLAPYSDRPETMGELLWHPEAMNRIVAKIDRLHLQCFIHATGDRGIRTALDAFEYARHVNGPRDSRHQIVHVECLSPEDLGRFAKLGVIACMQPRHCAPDITGQWAAAVGPERSKLAWAFRSLRDSGATLAFSSDWDVAEMDPLIGIYTALTRKGLDRDSDRAWIPDQTIDLETAIRGYTINGAYANFAETNRGSISPGKYADLVILSDDLFAITAEEIRDVRVLLTLVGGREVYSSPMARSTL